MDRSPVLAELPKAIPYTIGALVGGTLAVTGGVVAQYLTHRFTRQREAGKLKLTKAEELLCKLYAHEEWLDAKYNALLFQKVHEAPSPFNRALAIQRLYFPELTQSFRAFQEGSDPYVIALLVSHHEADHTRAQDLEPEARGSELAMQEGLKAIASDVSQCLAEGCKRGHDCYHPFLTQHI
jgi:hypothetical protein